MSEQLDNQYLFRPKLSKYNIIRFIDEADPKTISEMHYKDIVDYFSVRFAFAAEATKVDKLFKLYSQASDIFFNIAGEKSMRLKAHEHESIFTVLYWGDEAFKAFIDKFMPELIIVAGKNIIDPKSAPKEVERGKIVRFVNTPGTTYLADEALRESIPDLPKIG